MAYLQRRLDRLMDDWTGGTLHIADPKARDLVSDLDRVRRTPDGHVDLSTCSDAVRSLARSYWLAATPRSDAAPRHSAKEEDGAALSPRDYTSKLVELTDALFSAWTGSSVHEFENGVAGFPEAIHRLGAKLRDAPSLAAQRIRDGNDAAERLASFYQEHGGAALQQAATRGGVKAVLGGQQSLSSAGVRTATAMAMYADTVLVADPVLPWFERAPEAEGFANVRMLECAYRVAKLKPLAGLALEVPPLLVFPSWEKTLEDDPDFQENIERDTLAFFSHFLNARMDALSEVFEFADKRTPEFLEAVEVNRLFVPMGGDSGSTFKEAMAQHRDALRTWRSPAFMESIKGASDATLVVLAVCDRLAPQIHLRDNAEALRASPMLSLPVHWHYQQLMQRAVWSRWTEEEVVSAEAERTARALSDRRFDWLGNIAIESVAQIRERGEHRKLRDIFAKPIAALQGCTAEELNRIVPELLFALDSLEDDHRREATKLEEQFRAKNVQTALAGWTAQGLALAALLPVLSGVLAPATPALAVGVAVKYATDKLEHRREMKKHRGSLAGILAEARSGSSRRS